MRGNCCCMTYNSKNEAIFDSQETEEYKEKQKIWLCTTLLCTLFPFIAQCISLLFSHKFDFVSVINNGELVLLTYSITIPTLIELIQTKTDRQAKFVIYIFIWIFIILSDLLIYLSIKNPATYIKDNKVETYDNFLINLGATFIIMLSSIIFSQKTIRFIFVCNIETRQSTEQKVEGGK